MRGVRLLLTAASVLTCALTFAAGRPSGLTVERLVDPVGIDAPRPRLSWKNPLGVVRQTAYEIEADGWSSGKVLSSQQIDVTWAGQPITSSRRIAWRVRTWNEKDEVSDWSAPATFVTGLMHSEEWSAKWIGLPDDSLPEVDFASAKWVEGNALTNRFVAPGGRCDLVLTALEPFAVHLNGRKVYVWAGHVYSPNPLRFLDLTPFLRADATNELVVSNGRAVLAVLRTQGRVFGSSGADWGGRVLGGAREPVFARSVDFREERLSPAFAKDFFLDGEVKSAFLHVTGLGFYEAALNGRKIGDKVLDPSPTDYDERVLYSTYDLTGLLEKGPNVLRLLVGHGWYDMRSAAAWNFDEAPWRDRPKAIAQLEVEYVDGRRFRLVTDGSWRVLKSPVAYDCLREGEIGGNVGDSPAENLMAAEVNAPRGRLESAHLPGAKVVSVVSPREIRSIGNGQWVVTFPETVTGWCRWTFRGLASGDVVAMRYDENLASDGGPARSTAGDPNAAKREAGDARLIDCFFHASASHLVLGGESAMQTDRFVARGVGEETFEPRFVYHGFRHVIVSGLREPLRLEDVKACYIRTDFPETGRFACSDAQLTELVRLAQNSYKANFTDGVPTDCPHREKLGWTGDAWIASEFAQCYFENTAAYEKWLQDVIDTQIPSGAISCIAPTDGWGFKWGNGPVFDAALGMLPWNLWLFRADRRALEMAYPTLVRYLAYEKSVETSPDLVGNGLGDWNARVRSLQPPDEYVISCIYLRLREIASEIAALKGSPREAEEFAAAAGRTRAALHARYYRGNGVYANGRQSAQALALAFGLAPATERASVAARLVDAVEAEGRHYDCGLVGSKYIYRALSEIGRTDLAWAMLLNPTEPSMTKWIGKTGTLWEDWTYGLSKCHVMLGDFSAWAIEYVAGLRGPLAPGCAKILVKPDFSAPVDWAEGEMETPYGRCAVRWKRKGDSLELSVEVPPCAEAEVVAPDGQSRILGAGRHTLEF